MGWKGTLRSINSSLKTMERDAQRRQRELAHQQAAAQQLAERERIAYEVAVFENRLDVLTSVHREHSEPIDWQVLARMPEPEPPAPITENEDRAQTRLDTYNPGRLARAFRREARNQARLEAKLAAARDRDREETEAASKRFEQEYSDWERTKELADRVLEGDASAMIDAIREMDPFSDISQLGSSVEFKASDGGRVSAVVHVNGEDVIPKETKSQLKNGKLSVKAMPKGKYYELYQDYVCGCVLRVGTEVLSLLPVESVIITAVTPMLNSATGHMEEQAILSTLLPRSTLDGLNLDRLDPSDSMSNFVHRMDFKKTKGFAAVEVLTFADFAEADGAV